MTDSAGSDDTSALPRHDNSALPRQDRRASSRRRDRHGRGLRGPLAPPAVPLSHSPSERFDDLVLDVLEELERRWSEQLSGVDVAVEDVPDPDGELLRAAGRAPGSDEPVPWAITLPASPAHPARIVVFRRPLESRARDREDLADLVRLVVVDQVADLLGLPPDEVDPDYPGDD
ncbi:MAG: metallopeptidase family protein [Actinomycetales bacterium]